MNPIEQGPPTDKRHDAKAVRGCMRACNQSIPRLAIHQHCNRHDINRTFTLSIPHRLTAGTEANKSRLTDHEQSALSHRCAHQAPRTRSKQDIYPSDPRSTSLAAACLPNSTSSKPAVSQESITPGMNVCRRSEATKALHVSI